MKATINMETRRSEVGEYLLVNVSNNDGYVGICETSAKSGIIRKSFFIGGEPLVDFSYREHDDDSNRQIWQTSSIDKCKNILGNKFQTVCDGFFKNSVPLSKAIMPVLEMLTNGLYVVHVATMYPTDGAGNFFWNAYAVKHELTGSAPHNSVIGDEKCFAPPYIVPTKAFSAYSDKNIDATVSRINNGRKVGGIAYHLTGMFSALLYGHTNACACLETGEEFRCIIIEPLSRIMYGDDNGVDGGKIVALSCPSANIRFGELSRKMTESFLLNRAGIMPRAIDEIRSKSDKMMSSGVFSKKISPNITTRIDSLPDAEMLFSAFAIDELTDDQLTALLNGETETDGRLIISANYYESIVYACNYLQLTDKRRFIDFAKAILFKPELSGTYIYVAGRLKYIMDSHINEMFKDIAESDEPEHAQLKQIATQYGETYKVYSENSVRKFITNSMQSVEDEDDDKPIVSAPAGDEKQLSSIALANLISR